MTTPSFTGWRKATASTGNGQCLELLVMPDKGVAVRDSKDPDGPVLQFTAGEFRAFVEGCKAGEFDELG